MSMFDTPRTRDIVLRAEQKDIFQILLGAAENHSEINFLINNIRLAWLVRNELVSGGKRSGLVVRKGTEV